MDIINILNVLLKNEKYKPVEQKDSIAIRYHIDSIFNKTAAINLELIKFSLASPYIHTYIRYHGDKRKMETHDKAIFGPYIDDFVPPKVCNLTCWGAQLSVKSYSIPEKWTSIK